MKRVRQFRVGGKLRHKLMGIYLCIGTLPFIVLGIVMYCQQRNTLMNTEKRTISDALSQGISRLDAQMLSYGNLSDYIAYNSPISDALLSDYDSPYQLYEQYTDNVDPVLSSLRYFNPSIRQITIYIEKEIVRHDTTVAPYEDLEKKAWFREEMVTQSVNWIVDYEGEQVYCIRRMPLMEQEGYHSALYIEIDYQDFFAGFDEVSKEDYGIYIFDSENSVVYQTQQFKEDTGEILTAPKLKKRMKKKSSEYMFAEEKLSFGNWYGIIYRPKKVAATSIQDLIILIGMLLGLCVAVSIVAAYLFTRYAVKDIEKLQKNMKAVEQGDFTIHVTSEAKDEIGDLIRGFGTMTNQMNHLVNKVYEGQLKQRKYEMQALQAQINPHFLYNSLSLINWKALEAGKEDISKLTLALSSFYRTSLNKGSNVLTIERELENMKSYVEIQSCMHDNSFDVIMDIDEAILPYQTLNLLLQPLVENAIEHGIDLLEERLGYIKIIGRKDSKKIYLIVEDNGVGIDEETAASILEYQTKGYGVRNVNQRIRLFYGEEYELKIESMVGKGTKAIITLPLIK